MKPVAALALLALAACGAHAGLADRVHDDAPIAEPLAPPIAFGPITDAALLYNAPGADAPTDSAASASTALSADVLAGLVAFTGARGVIARDARLDRTADDLAPMVVRGAALTPAVVELALHARGVVEPAARVLIAHGTEAPAILGELTAALGDELFFSNVRIGISGASPTVVVITHTARVTLAPTPRSVETGGELALAAVLAPEFHAPHATITREDGSVEHPPITRGDAGAFTLPFTCGVHLGAQWVLVEACDLANTPTRLVLVPISCGTPPPASYQLEPIANTAAITDVARRLTAIINRERVAAHLAPLVTEAHATLAAQRYAAVMRDHYVIAHDADGRSPADRLRAVGLVPPVLLEAALHASDVGAAAEILLNDPTYRAPIDRAELTHLGLGVARDAHGELFVAIEYVQIPPPIDVARVVPDVVARMRAAAPASSYAEVDQVLADHAHTIAAGLARGLTQQQAMTAVLDELGYAGYHRIQKGVVMVLDPAAVDGAQLVEHRRFDYLGVGVVQSPRYGPLTGRIWVVALFALADKHR